MWASLIWSFSIIFARGAFRRFFRFLVFQQTI